MSIDFGEWVDEKRKKLGKNQKEFAELVGVSEATISMAKTGKRGIGVDTYVGIANALNLPLIEVLRAANILPPPPEINVTIERAIYYLSQLHPEDQERVMLYLEVLAARYKLGGIRP